MHSEAPVEPGDTVDVTIAPNIGFVTPRLATGGDLHHHEEVARAQLQGLIDVGITHIMDCRIEWTDEHLVAQWAPGIEYFHNGVDDDGGKMPDRWFDLGLAFLREALVEPDAKALVHCHMGINRGPSMVYRALLDDGFDVVGGLDAIRAARPIAGIGYAHDALDHFHRRSSAPKWERDSDHRALQAWFEENEVDVVSIIRGIRAEEGTLYR